MISRNLSRWDRAFRIVLGFLMLLVGWQASIDGLTLLLRVFAPYPLITGFIGWCPVYALLRFRTRRP